MVVLGFITPLLTQTVPASGIGKTMYSYLYLSFPLPYLSNIYLISGIIADRT